MFPEQQAMNPLIGSYVPLILIIGVFYFLVIRPQKKQQREHQKMLSSMAKNDEVVTSGGIHGTIVGVKDKTVIVRIDDNVKIEVDRSAVTEVKKKSAAA